MSYCLDNSSRTSRVTIPHDTDMSKVLEMLIEFKIKYVEGQDLHGLYVNLPVDHNLVGGKFGQSISYVFNQDESFKWITMYD